MATEELKDLLQSQINNYRKALELERELAESITAADFKAMTANTEDKKRLMAGIQQTYGLLLPQLKRNQVEGGKGRLADPHCEGLRQQAVELLRQVVEAEALNLKAINKSREGAVSALKEASTARRAARGYHPPGGGHRYLDTKS